MLNFNERNIGIKENIVCEICGDYSDGNHYNIQACRSCTAFFRRTVTFKKKYNCNGDNNCIVNYQSRNTCKSCRYRKCLAKGMNILSVQPRREPTGAQPNRKNRRTSLPNSTLNVVTKIENNTNSNNSLDFSLNQEEISNIKTIEENVISRTEDSSKQSENCKENNIKSCDNTILNDFMNSLTDIERNNLITIFKKYVRKYIEIKNSLKYVHITDPITIINDSAANLPLRLFTSQDMILLARSDLTSVTLWLSQIEEYSNFTSSEKASLLQRFALRKIMLDHFYMTSKYKDHFEKGNLVMPNYTYIPADKTGYEKENDNFFTKEILYNTFRETLDYAIECVVKPMNELNLTDEEIVFLYLLILWNKNNEKYVSNDKRHIFMNQRDLASKYLFLHYWEKNVLNPEIRFGEITLLLKEFEWCFTLHCEDYMTSKFFNTNILKEKWYDNVCYSKINFGV